MFNRKSWARTARMLISHKGRVACIRVFLEVSVHASWVSELYYVIRKEKCVHDHSHHCYYIPTMLLATLGIIHKCRISRVHRHHITRAYMPSIWQLHLYILTAQAASSASLKNAYVVDRECILLDNNHKHDHNHTYKHYEELDQDQKHC